MEEFKLPEQENCGGALPVQVSVWSKIKNFLFQEIKVELTESAMNEIIEAGYDPVYGARPLKRYLQKTVETLCARLILEGKAGEGDIIRIDNNNGLVAYTDR